MTCSFENVKKACSQILAFLRAHKIPVALSLVGLAGGFLGFLAGLGAGCFVEIIVRRIQEEKTAQKSSAEQVFHIADEAESERKEAYRTLGVPFGASMDEIKAAHRRLAAQYHPDASEGDSVQFLRIQHAYEMLEK